jgi:hypothetical protein
MALTELSPIGSHRAAATDLERKKVAILIPCYNEAKAIGGVVTDFRRACPAADIYVYDNNSTDQTSAHARDAGAIVRHEPSQGKGNVVRRMFADVSADVYVLVDGDGTYDASVAPELVEKLILGRLDFVNAAREPTVESAYRPAHRYGNRLLTGLVRKIFGRQFTDMLSGYKVLSRRFVKSFPAMSSGFEIETEISVHGSRIAGPLRRGRDGIWGADGRLGEQAADLPGWLWNPVSHCASNQGRAAISVLWVLGHRSCCGGRRAEYPALAIFPGDRHRAAVSNRYSMRRPCSLRDPELSRRTDP